MKDINNFSDFFSNFTLVGDYALIKLVGTRLQGFVEIQIVSMRGNMTFLLLMMC